MLVETEDATTRFVKPAVDIDDTIPVALYTNPYARMEIDASARRPPPTPIPRGLFAAVLVAAFGSGFALVVLLAG